MRPRRRTLFLHPERNQFFARTNFFCLQQRIATDEIWFAYIDEESESRLDRVALRREIRTIKRVAHVQPQRIARAQPTRLNSKRLALFKHSAPKLDRVVCRKENFDAILAGVSGAGDRNVRSLKGNINNVISRRKLDVFTEQRMK